MPTFQFRSPSPSFMHKLFLTAAVALSLTTQVCAQPVALPKPVAESEAMQIKGHFAGSLIVTSDADWKKKWDTPANAMPSFDKASVLAYGKKVFILTLFANPPLDAAGSANLRCDFKIINPSGKVQLSRSDLSCHAGRLARNKHNVYLSEPVIAFSGDPGDPPGIWVVEVKLRDTNRANRSVELLMRSSFELKAGK
jgi:hypothetical protein